MVDRRISVNGKQLEARHIAAQASDTPTLVLLHEGLGCVELWKDLPETLARETGFGVFAYSRFGYGRSSPMDRPPPLEYLAVEALQILPRVLDEVPTAEFILIGHSDGASIGTIYASRHAEFLSGLVLIAPHFFVEPLSLDGIRDARERYVAADLRDRLGRYHDDVDGAFFAWNDAWLDPSFRQWNIEGCLKNIDTPVLVIQGLNDPYGSVLQVDAAKRHLPNEPETLLLPHCGHTPHVEQRHAVVARLVEFCRGVST